PATITAIETVDSCLGELSKSILSQGGALCITADHGNAEIMISDDGEMETQHNSGIVPLIVVGEDLPGKLTPGVLANVSPTLLQLLQITPPKEMTEKSLWTES